MNRGAHTSIVDNLPVDQKKDEQAEEAKRVAEEKSKFSHLSKTEAGEALIGMILTELSAKVQEFLNSDAECVAYNNMLKKIHLKELDGKTAVQKYVDKFFPAFSETPKKEPAV